MGRLRIRGPRARQLGRRVLAFAVLWPALGGTPDAAAQQTGGGSWLTLELEGGPAWQSRNDVQVPNDETGSRFALDGLVGSGPFPAARVYAEARLGRRHGLRLLVAPLSLSGTGAFSEPVRFDGVEFAAAEPTEGSYRFDSYRITYAYRLVESSRWSVDLGLTAKLRVAEIELEQAEAEAAYSNTGFVPLLHAAASWRPAPRWTLTLDADGAAASQGRAFDVSLKLYRELSDRWAVSLGYRTLEGGADVEDVYTFAWFHYATASAVYRF